MNATTWGIGLLLFGSLSLHAATPELSLAKALAKENDWAACLHECRRIELANPGNTEVIGLRKTAEAEVEKSNPPSPVWRRIGALPVRGMVFFYRTAIAPALGSRCLLEPSCSRYSMQAARERGWLGLPMTGDRLIREPTIVSLGAHPVTNAQGRVHFMDPVTDHVGLGTKGGE